MKKKILSLILVAAMLASMLVFAPVSGATADTKATVDVTETAGVAGDTVTVDVVVTMNAKDDVNPIVTFVGLVEYDRSRLKLESAIRTDVWKQDPNADARNDNNPDLAPYTKDGWTSLCAWNCEDATDGVVAFTLTFSILGTAAVGDAYVKFHHIGDTSYRVCMVNYDTTPANYLDEADEINYIAGGVTVLPAGYNVAPSIEGMRFVNNGDGATATLQRYYGEATELVIPEYWYDAATGETLKVTNIGSFVFCSVENGKQVEDEELEEKISGNDTIEKIVIPATVTDIDDYAFANGESVEEIILLGAPTIGKLALGTSGAAWKKAGGANFADYYDLTPMLPDSAFEDGGEVEALVVLKGVDLAVLNAYNEDIRANVYDAYLEDEIELYATFPVEAYAPASGNLTVNVGDASDTYFVYGVDAITAPTVANVLVWKDAEGNTYLPGADLNGATEITAVTVEAPVSSENVTAKITDEFAMRFQATVSKATYDAMAELGDVTMGMLITPRQYVVKAGNAFTKEALDALVAGTEYKGYVDVPVQNPISANAATFEECTEFTIAGSLSGLKASTAQKNPDFVAIGYLQVALASGDVVTVYGEYNYLAANNVGDFLDGLKTDGLGDTELGWIKAWKDLFNN